MHNASLMASALRRSQSRDRLLRRHLLLHKVKRAETAHEEVLVDVEVLLMRESRLLRGQMHGVPSSCLLCYMRITSFHFLSTKFCNSAILQVSSVLFQHL
jgi:hypothetical protein